MIKVNGMDIMVSRGDTLELEFNILGYEVQSEDTVVFSVKKQ